MKIRIHRFCALTLISVLWLFVFAAAQTDLQRQPVSHFGCPPSQVRRKTAKPRKASAANTPAHYTYEVLYNFCSKENCTDGVQVSSDLIRDAEDNLYGVTSGGGTANHGVAFQLDTAGNYAVLYSFCSQPNCADGSGPNSLVMDSAGNLYGTASGGAKNNGVVFELAPPTQSEGAWTETVLYNFCSAENCSDGSGPTGVILDAAGNLYGATGSGGAAGAGTVFELSPPSQPGGTWAETVLYAFCSLSGCEDGANPDSGLIQDGRGNLYGTTGPGWVFEVSPPNGSVPSTETVLYSSLQFSDPGVIMDSGNLYGTTGYGTGTVYELIPTPSGGGCGCTPSSQWTETTIYNFCSLANCADGAFPASGLIMDTAGNLYGTTFTGGLDAIGPSLGAGIVYELVPLAQCDPVVSPLPCWTETALYSFCSDGGTNCTDGQHPSTGLLRDPVGSLYGATSAGGSHGRGTLYTLAVPSFTVAGSSVSLDPGADTGNTATITLYPRGGFTGKVALAAVITSKPSGAQDLPTLSLASNSVSITDSSAVKVILTINTTSPTEAALEHSARPRLHWYASGMTLAFRLIFGVGICIPIPRRTRRKRVGSLLLLMILAFGLPSCGGGTGSSSPSSSSPGTTPGSYVVTVTGTSGSITAMGTVSLTVQ
jgi:uncharacterized repeat protein (TIGR03803 family)